MLSDEEKEEAWSETEIRFRADLLILNSEFPTHRKTEAMEELLEIYNKQSKEIEELRDKCKELIFEKQELTSALLDSTPDDKIKAKIEEIETMYNKLPKNPKEHLHSKTEYKIVIGELQSLLEKE